MSTAALAAHRLAPHRSPEPAVAPVTTPVPVTAPRRRPRIDGATDSLPVRACSGEALGRHATPTRQRPEVEPSALRLTRRGRMLLTAVSVLIFGSAIVVLGLRVTGVLEPGPRFTHTVPVQVAPGQTLWSIAQNTNPTEDPATIVEKIADLNKLSSPADITPGETLQIPIAG
ncbi:LysM peptidoglycan-binding domain-containing protein [Kribbella pratensis]|jgi:nucleoid-associated protein YgaU|uniref:LysM domain-containing protein n=1 Tax=Kribbella pratensis TaxID=2512112 RepID=A0A4R8BMF4_9ACTN|nr:LysM domain-containing protein [Kribbella pratensis]TDW54937.1 LysM domain-containing protein [Kribbella pratensis]